MKTVLETNRLLKDTDKASKTHQMPKDQLPLNDTVKMWLKGQLKLQTTSGDMWESKQRGFEDYHQ